jgi:Protein of unknown function (DUF1616)
MKLGDYKIIFMAVALVGVLLIASPAIAGAIHLPAGEEFSELYLLGPDQMAQNYPSNIAVNQNYSVYADVGNHLGSSAYYLLYVKLANSSDQLPDTTLDAASTLPPLYEYRFSIKDGAVWQKNLSFKVTDATISSTTSQIHTLQINDATMNVEKSAVWNSNSSKFSYILFFELWLYNQQTGALEFNSRYVSLQLNLTRTS